MKIIKNKDISALNTFLVKAKAKFFTELEKEKDIEELFQNEIFQKNQKLFLGGGSNILFVQDFDGLIILNSLKGTEIVTEDEETVEIRAMGGEKWNDLVMFSVERGYWGIENLTLVPGTVGASPIQNIGAYGVEVKDVIRTVEGYEISSGKKRIFTNEECDFGYRDSIFKKALKDKYFISAITIKLNKKAKKITDYKALNEYINKNQIKIESSKDVSKAVEEIRKSKLPDPKIIGNAGSFFKNVFIDEKKLEELLKKYPKMPYFKEETFSNTPFNILKSTEEKKKDTTQKKGGVRKDTFENKIIKIPAGWLIEQCGFKGKKEGRVGVHEHQALVLVNYGGATGQEIKNFSEKIQTAVYEKFGLNLSREVNLI